DLERYVQVAGRTAAPSLLSPCAHPELHPVGHAGGDLHGEGLLVGRSSLAPARGAGRSDLLTGPLADGAGAGGHHGAEHAPGDVLNLPGASAPTAPGHPRPGLAAGAAASLADPKGLHGAPALGAEGSF